MDLKKAKKNIFSAVFFIATSIFIYFYAIPREVPMRASWGGGIEVGSRFFPYFSAVSLGIFAFIFLVKSCFEYKKVKQKESQYAEAEKMNTKDEIRAIEVYGLFIFYAILFVKIGYILSTLIVPTVILLFLGERKILQYLIIYALGGSLFVIFKILLNIQLP